MRCRFVALALVLLGACTRPVHRPLSSPAPAAEPFVVVLGIAQDGGDPQAGCNAPHCLPGWNDPRLRHTVASIAIVDPANHQRWIIDATPDFPSQLRALDRIAPPRGRPPALDGILLTHAHIGHYTGLIHLGREVIGAHGVAVWAMPRMAAFLRSNGPWDQLIHLGNIEIREIEEGRPVRLNARIMITAIVVPHRDEYSETVGFRIEGPRRKALYIPDIDKWERWNVPVEEHIRAVDVAWLDGTFYAEGELPGRSMAEIPHPFVVESLERFATLALAERAKIRFIHFNHTNPLLRPGAAQERVERARMGVAQQGERFGI